MFEVSAKVVVVTGGTDGIGHACAVRLARAGASVWIAGRRQDGAAIASEMGARFHHCDVSDEESVHSMVAAVVESHGRIDVLVQSAGYDLDPVPLVEREVQEMRGTFEVNVLGAVRCIKHARPFMPRGSSIINIGSLGGVIGIPGFGDHAVAKFALNGIGRTAAIELGPAGIRVNTVCPGVVRTPFVDSSNVQETMTSKSLCEGTSALASLVEPDDVAALVHFLASDDSGCITGQEIVVDAGITAGFSIGLYNTIMAANGLPEFS